MRQIMRTENTGKKCFVCGKENGFTKGKECVHCGAGEYESAIAHLLVKYSGGEQAGIPESTDQLRYRRILAIDASKTLQDALVNCELFTCVSKEELNSITGARDGLGFERILALSDIDDKTAVLINKLLAENGIVIVKQAASEIYEHTKPGPGIGCAGSCLWRRIWFRTSCRNSKKRCWYGY